MYSTSLLEDLGWYQGDGLVEFMENGNRIGTESGNGNHQWKMPHDGYHGNIIYRLDYASLWEFLDPSTLKQSTLSNKTVTVH